MADVAGRSAFLVAGQEEGGIARRKFVELTAKAIHGGNSNGEKEVEAFIKFRREKLHELPWLKKYGITQLFEESAWSWKYFRQKVARANKPKS
jgi:hypothetical protein